MAEFRIVVVVDPSGAQTGNRRVRGELQRTENAATRLQRVLGRAFAFAGIGIGVRQLGSLSDSFVNVRNSVNIATQGFGDSAQSLNDVFQVANRVRQPVGAISSLYQRAALAADELGASNQQLLQFVTAVGQGLAIQGTGANTARGALIQLGQAIGSDVVRAEEFNSILEGALPIAQAAARGIDEAGGSVARLRRLIAEGNVTSEAFFNAILSQGESLDELFQNIEPTLGQAFTTLQNGIIRSAEALLEFTGPLAGFITNVGNALAVVVGFEDIEFFPAEQQNQINQIIGLLTTLGDVAQTVGTFLAVNFAAQGVGAAVGAIGILSRALLTNPFGILLTAITLAGAALVGFGDRLRLTADGSATVFDFITVLFQDFQTVVQSVLETASGFLAQFQGDVDSFDFGQFAISAAQAGDRLIAVFQGTFAGLRALFANFPEVAGDLLISGINRTLTALRGLPNTFLSLFERAFDFVRNAAISFVNGLIQTLNRVPGVAIETIRQAEGVVRDLLDDGQLINPFSGAAADIGMAVNEGFRDSLDDGLLENFVRGGIQRAEELANRSNIAVATDAAGNTTANARPAGGGAGAATPGLADRNSFLQRELELLQQEGELLGQSAIQRQNLAGILSVEQGIRSALRQANRELTEEQLNNLSRLTEAERENFLAVLESNRIAQVRANILDQINEPTRSLNEELAITRQLLSEDPGNSLLIERIRELNVEITALDNSLQGGIQNGLSRLIEQSNQLGSQISDFVVGAFDQATNAVVEFARTGEFSVRQFFGQLASQLLQIATNQLFSQLLGGLFGGGGGGGGGLGGILGNIGGLLGFQNGGDFMVGGAGGADSQLVAFRATPGERVSVETPSQQRNNGAQVNVAPPNISVVNVTDPEEAISAIDSARGEEMILNIIERNRNEVSRVLS